MYTVRPDWKQKYPLCVARKVVQKSETPTFVYVVEPWREKIPTRITAGIRSMTQAPMRRPITFVGSYELPGGP